LYIALRTAPLSEDALKKFLSLLSVTVEARAVGSVTIQPGDGKPTQLTQANELLHSLTLDDNEEPTICAVEFQSENMSVPARYLYVLWKVSLPIGMFSISFQEYSGLQVLVRPPKNKDSENGHILCHVCISEIFGKDPSQVIRR
jgi:hypothetical protein